MEPRPIPRLSLSLRRMSFRSGHSSVFTNKRAEISRIRHEEGGGGKWCRDLSFLGKGSETHGVKVLPGFHELVGGRERARLRVFQS